MTFGSRITTAGLLCAIGASCAPGDIQNSDRDADASATDARDITALDHPDVAATDVTVGVDTPIATPDVPTGTDAVDAASLPCEPIPSVSYQTLTVSGPPTDRPAAMHGDLNLLLRTWSVAAGAARSLITINGPTDALAPRLNTLFAPPRVPGFPHVYQVQSWDWGCNCPGALIADPEVTLAGMATTPGEILTMPTSGYDIGGGNDAMVLYAARNTITLKFTREDNVVYGYAIHITGFCVEPSLLALYRSSNSAGRGSLPALRSGQPFGRATGAEIQVAVRDTGSWMDPRSHKDWWPP